METIGSKRSYALTWCMPNNNDDDDDDDDDDCCIHFPLDQYIAMLHTGIGILVLGTGIVRGQYY